MDSLLNLVLNEFEVLFLAVPVPFFYTIALSDLKMKKYFSGTKEYFQDL